MPRHPDKFPQMDTDEDPIEEIYEETPRTILRPPRRQTTSLSTLSKNGPAEVTCHQPPIDVFCVDEEEVPDTPEPFVHPNGSTTIAGPEWSRQDPYTDPNYPLSTSDQSLRMWMVTVTYPGGVTDVQKDKLIKHFNDQKMLFLLVREGGVETTGQHVHYHALIWAPCMRRSDSITRAVRTAIYTTADIADIRTDHLVRTSAVSNWDQAWSYVFKDMIKYPNVPTMMCHLPLNFDLERCYADAVERERARTTTTTLFPTEGTKWWETRSVPDNLIRAAAELGVHMPDQFAFAHLVQQCYARGIRFDLSKGKYYRLSLEMILAKDKPSEVLIHELALTFNK